ncbi:MAG: hypothetical protein ACREA1_01170 [Nitrosotalea sp.]
MRENLKETEYIVASLPQIWGIILGFRGFFHKTKEGVLVLTNKNLIFVPRYLFITPKEKEKHFGEGKAMIAKITDYDEDYLDEDLTENPKSWIIPLDSIKDVKSVTARKVDFLRITFTEKGKTKEYEFGITKTVTNYPYRQPLVFKNIDWNMWIDLVKSEMKKI